MVRHIGIMAERAGRVKLQRKIIRLIPLYLF